MQMLSKYFYLKFQFTKNLMQILVIRLTEIRLGVEFIVSTKSNDYLIRSKKKTLYLQEKNNKFYISNDAKQ